MERECRRCGRVYRGLVCHACHPRREKADVKAKGVKADEITSGCGPRNDGLELRVTNELTGTAGVSLSETRDFDGFGWVDG